MIFCERYFLRSYFFICKYLFSNKVYNLNNSASNNITCFIYCSNIFFVLRIKRF